MSRSDFESNTKISINSSAIKGEPGTGYEDEAGLGEFECGNCGYWQERDRQRGCYQRDMMKKSKKPRNKNGSVKVEEEGCCEYVDRVGRKDEANEE